MLQPQTIENSISYLVPMHGRILPSNNRFPESYSLHVCPSACGRRFGLRALQCGEKEFVSFLVITEADIVSGHYENIVSDAIGELLLELAQKPRIFFIYFYCIDDLLGTDEKALLERLRKQFPTFHFLVVHVDPIAMEERLKSNVRRTSQIYDLLEYSGKKDNGINLIGNNAPISSESEFFRVLSGWGITQVRQRFGMKTFAEFMQMADSRLNLMLSYGGKYTAQNMARKLDIPYLVSQVSYDIDEIVKAYRDMADILGTSIPDFSRDIEQTRQTVRETLAHIGDTPLVIDATATSRPFGMAKALCRCGFNVQAVFFVRLPNGDKENREWLEYNFPQVSIVRSQDYKFIMDAGYDRECIAIGFESAFTIRAKHFVDIRLDGSFFGFHGVRKLMQLIIKAYDTTADWERIKEMDKELLRI